MVYPAENFTDSAYLCIPKQNIKVILVHWPKKNHQVKVECFLKKLDFLDYYKCLLEFFRLSIPLKISQLVHIYVYLTIIEKLFWYTGPKEMQQMKVEKYKKNRIFRTIINTY